ncbi:hypothetical protein ASG31_00860 [Chryseobacterium sp. Leaf404]|uniref:hypothetical protein n=1 Tax=unclassified Chryseobacterium TaxID=2593645 RepID=UPI0006FCD06C|nr:MULTISPECIES: hypothetical protein [unclassified Chryseobacterium]KQT21926.1 hypothetical protein ASG31_00860 [Chryseobacterium sp. Leaf404]
MGKKVYLGKDNLDLLNKINNLPFVIQNDKKLIELDELKALLIDTFEKEDQNIFIPKKEAFDTNFSTSGLSGSSNIPVDQISFQQMINDNSTFQKIYTYFAKSNGKIIAAIRFNNNLVDDYDDLITDADNTFYLLENRNFNKTGISDFKIAVEKFHKDHDGEIQEITGIPATWFAYEDYSNAQNLNNSNPSSIVMHLLLEDKKLNWGLIANVAGKQQYYNIANTRP